MMAFWFLIHAVILVTIAFVYCADKLSDKFAKKVALWLGGEWDEDDM